jgi:hypothetical protein
VLPNEPKCKKTIPQDPSRDRQLLQRSVKPSHWLCGEAIAQAIKFEVKGTRREISAIHAIINCAKTQESEQASAGYTLDHTRQTDIYKK